MSRLAAVLALTLAACTCPPPVPIDQVFLLDATADAPVADAGTVDGGGPAPMSAPSRDCTPAAAGCVPGGACRPACDCVIARDGVRDVVTVTSCVLLAASGPPQVEVRYEQAVFCGGD